MLGGTSHGKTIGGEKLRPYFLHGLIGFNASRISRFIVIYCFLKYRHMEWKEWKGLLGILHNAVN